MSFISNHGHTHAINKSLLGMRPLFHLAECRNLASSICHSGKNGVAKLEGCPVGCHGNGFYDFMLVVKEHQVGRLREWLDLLRIQQHECKCIREATKQTPFCSDLKIGDGGIDLLVAEALDVREWLDLARDMNGCAQFASDNWLIALSRIRAALVRYSRLLLEEK